MPTRSSTSEYQPSPAVNRLNSGKVVGRLAVKTGASGVKTNMCVAPATNGERAFGKVTASQPASTTKGMKVTPSIG